MVHRQLWQEGTSASCPPTPTPLPLEAPPVAPQVPPSPSSGSVVAAAEKTKEEACLAHVGGSLIDPRKIMLQDKLAFVFGESPPCASCVPGFQLPESTLPQVLGDAPALCALPSCCTVHRAHTSSSAADPAAHSPELRVLSAAAGVANVCLTAFWVGRWPDTYHYFWLLKARPHGCPRAGLSPV